MTPETRAKATAAEVQMAAQPLITFAIIAYNQEDIIHEAIYAAFAQTYSPLEIILSDDHSPDGTFAVMQEMAANYQGPHKIVLNRNANNQRLASHVNTVMALAKGEIVVLAAGDDISTAERAARSWEILQRNKDCMCVSFSSMVFHDREQREGPKRQTDYALTRYSINALLERDSFHINGAARSYRKAIYEQFGALRADSPTEDSTLLLRCLLLGQVLKSEEPMVWYRVHGNNIYASSNKHHIDYRKIHQQYLDDLRTARTNGLLDASASKKIEEVLARKLFKRELRSDFFHSGHKVQFLLQRVLFSPRLRLSEKTKFVKLALKGDRG